MRLPAAVLAAFVVGASAAHAFEPNQSRPGGGFLQTPAATTQACARACENDALCMAWTHQPQQAQSCELKAVIPPARYQEGATSGLSSRAPRLMRLIPPAQPPAPPADLTKPATVSEAASPSPDGEPKQRAEPPRPTPHATAANLSEAAAVADAADSAADLVQTDLSGDQPIMSVRLGERINPAPRPAPDRAGPAPQAKPAPQPQAPADRPVRRPPALRSGR
jgi:hypothetical protein